MSTVIGDRDVLLLGSSQRALNPLNSDIILTPSAPAFKVDTSGNPLPSTITITASLIGITGFVTFSATGASVTDNGDNTATLAYSSLTGQSCTVTASITVNGQNFTRHITLSKVTDGASGTSGTSGNQYATAYLYQWAASAPALPNGTTGYTWATGVNSTYTGTDNWGLNPSNPGTSGLKLYVAAAQITAPGGTASTVVSYSNATVQVWSANGANGVSGVQSTTVQVYRWDSSTAPAAPAGSATYVWSGAGVGTFGAAPSGWVLSPGVAPSQGMTLWVARVRVTDSATNSSTTFNWSDSAIIAVGSSGSNGSAGTNGASYVTAYCASSTGTTSTAPAQTTGKTSLPATNDGGITGAWSSTVPTLSTGQYLYQSDGIYDPSTNKVTWSIPYWSSLKVGNLSAITVNTGRLYISDTISDSGGNWSVDSNGHAILKSFELQDSAGNTILKAGSTLPRSYVPDVALNNLIDLSWWSHGASIPWTQNAEYNTIATCSPVSGADLLMPGPKGSDDAIWYCKEVTGDGNMGGGWNGPFFSLDPTKTYRFAIPIRRISGTGTSYWGTHAVANLNTTTIVTDDNPYFAVASLSNTDRWYLFVGYIYPANSVGNTSDSAGVWDCKTGAKIATGSNFCFMPDGRQVNHRAYQYYATPNSEQVFGRPMINLVDGTEPSLREYFESAAVLNSQQQWVDVSGNGKPADYATVSGADAATSLGFNPQFSNWTGTYPAGWSAWTAPTPVKETGTIRTSPYAVKWTVSGDTGMSASTSFPTPLPAGTFVQGAFDINILANNGGGSPGYLIRLFTNQALSVYTDTVVGVADRSIGGWQRVPFTARVPAGQQIWGVQIYQMAAYAGMPGGSWANGSVCVFDNLMFDFKDATTDNTQQKWVDVSGTGRPADNATVGAPTGTYVGSTLAQTVETNAANGNSAYSAVNDGTTGLAQRLRANAANILSGSGGLAAGSLTWDSSGNRTGGYGVGMNQKGIVAYNSSGVATFTLDGSTGSATFAGTLASGTVMSQNLSALSATIGTLRTRTSGGRVEISDDVIKVFDDSNNKRCQIGNLSL